MRDEIQEWQRNMREEMHNMEKRLQAGIDKKRDDQVASLEAANMRTRLAVVEQLSNEAKAEAREPHICHQGEALQDIRTHISSIHKTLNSWRTLKLSAVIALILALLSGAWFVFQIKGDQAVLNVKMLAVDDKIQVLTYKGDSMDVKILETLRSMQEDIKSVKRETNEGKK